MSKGIDVAKWNAINDYNAVKNAGVEFAIVKVINKGNTADSSFVKHVTGFKNAGIPCNMGYTYSYANTETKATTSANAFVKYAKEQGINYMWLDLEDTCMRGLAGRIVAIINVYKQIAKNNGMDFGIYTYSDYYNRYIKPYISQLSNVPFWIARYPSTKEMSITDSIPNKSNLPTGIEISGWQYTSKGKIDGIKGYVDLNFWYENKPVTNDATAITTDSNPFTEPTANCKVGTLGNDANWCLWYLWRFGYLTTNGQPDSTLINGTYSKDTAEKVKEVQKLLGLTADGIVGTKTRAVFKKLA
jgi:GH25 family lysozyme M1 (1,4-beta-N-acetylmuramidase)